VSRVRTPRAAASQRFEPEDAHLCGVEVLEPAVQVGRVPAAGE